jgi:hypothetical protein
VILLWNLFLELSKGLLEIEIGTVTVLGIWVTWWVYLGVLLFRKRRRFPRTWIWTAFTLVGIAVVEGLASGFESRDWGNARKPSLDRDGQERCRLRSMRRLGETGQE